MRGFPSGDKGQRIAMIPKVVPVEETESINPTEIPVTPKRDNMDMKRTVTFSSRRCD